MTDAPPPNYEGKIVAGRYRVEHLLGRGGMGSVWAGRHVSLSQLVAIKFVHPDLATSREALRRFDTEAKAAARIKSRHAVAVIDHGVTEQNEPYIVMEYLEGETLERAVAERGKLPLPEVIEVVDQAARALTAAHAEGVVHRDLKPDNIFLARDREAGVYGWQVKLVDFGISKMLEGSSQPATQAGIVLGTPHFMSPEAFNASGLVTKLSDIWGLGVCAFAAACGRIPFQGDAMGEILVNVCAAPMPVPSKVNPELPAAFDAWFATACSRRPEGRFPSPAAAAEALRDLDGWDRRQRAQSAYELRAAGGRDFVLDEAQPRASRRGLLLAGVLVGISLTLAALGYYVQLRTRTATAEAARVADSARAIIDAENERRIREAEQWLEKSQAGGAVGRDAGAAGQRGRP